jgi:3-dehydroquinate dehydratase/shikimate dehydrogenase
MSTRLTAPIFVTELETALAMAARASELGADLVEYRIDQFTEPAKVIELVERSPLPCLLTCRPVWEGGHFDGDEMARISLIEHSGLGPRQPAYIDVELAAWQKSANIRQKVSLVVDHPAQVRPTSTGLILSSHDFQTRPADLYQRVEAMAAAPACRVIKVAWRARSLRDNIEAFEIIQKRYKPTIALCMGEYGLASRILAKKFQAMLTFASIDSDSGTAPGQPTISELKNTYRWDAINPATRVYGVIGHPVSHSMSPAIHNAGFSAINYDGVYLPMPIEPEYEQFKATVLSWLDMDDLHFSGASVTIPHKENLLRFVREQGGQIEPLTEQIGAANTLTRLPDGTLYASNTDYGGALDAVCDGLSISREQLKDLRVAVIGAGGAARAIVAGLSHYGATTVVYNRTLEKAQALADQFNNSPAGGRVVAAKLEKLCDSCCQVYINCTPIGMHPNIGDTPLPVTPKSWGAGIVVFDTIYNPLETRLLREARLAGCYTIQGTEMFIRQAAAQFKLWTGKEAPINVMRKTLLTRLGH